MASPGMKKRLLAALGIASLAACSGGPGDGGARSAGLAEAPPLPTVDAVAWANVAEGCEGRLDGSEDFAITRRDALVVARRGSSPVCVDTLEAITLELEGMDEVVLADELYGGFVAAINLAQVEDWATPTSGSAPSAGLISGSPIQGDPHPQPSLGGDVQTQGGGAAMGDPSPQPSSPRDGRASGDPSPQPSGPSAPVPPSPVQPTPDTPR